MDCYVRAKPDNKHGPVESPSEVRWLRFSATPPLRRCPLCLCVLAGGLSEDPSHPGNWWACDVTPLTHLATASPPPLHALVRHTNQCPGRSGHVRVPPFLSWLPWQPAPVQAASCCGEERGRRREEKQERDRGEREGGK